MFQLVILATCLALCNGHVVPFVPVHATHGALIAPYHHGYTGLGVGHGHVGGFASEFGHGLAGGHLVAGHGYGLGHGIGGGLGVGAGHGLGAGHGFGAGHELGAGLAVGGGLGHGLVAGHASHGVGHHILKRSPHYVTPVVHAAPVVVAPVHVAPVAVSHQQRVDFHGSHAVLPIVPVKPIVAPYLHGAPLLHKGFGGYGAGAYGHF